MSTASSDIQILFNINKVKYDDLYELFPRENFSDSSINFYLDARKIFESFYIDYYKEITNKVLANATAYSYEVAAEFFNFIGHYRNFFNKYNTTTRFILFHGNLDDYKSSINPDWNQYYLPSFLDESEEAKRTRLINKFTTFIVEKRIRNMAKLIPNVFVVSTTQATDGFVDSIMVPFILAKYAMKHDKREGFSEDVDTVIVSNDVTAQQYIYTHRNTAVLKANTKSPKLLIMNTIFEEICKKHKSPKFIEDEKLRYYLEIIGNKSLPPIHDAFKLKVVTDALANIKTAGTDRDLNEEDLKVFTKILDKAGITLKDFSKMLVDRYKVLSIPGRYVEMSSSQVIDITSQLDSTPSKAAAFELNQKYFDNNINLTVLF